MCSYHLCLECSSPITCFHLGIKIFQKCDIVGGDIKEVNVLLSLVSRMFQSSHMFPPWHIFSEYVILQEVT